MVVIRMMANSNLFGIVKECKIRKSATNSLIGKLGRMSQEKGSTTTIGKCKCTETCELSKIEICIVGR